MINTKCLILFLKKIKKHLHFCIEIVNYFNTIYYFSEMNPITITVSAITPMVLYKLVHERSQNVFFLFHLDYV